MTFDPPRPTRPWILSTDPGPTGSGEKQGVFTLERLAVESHWRLLLPATGGTEGLWRRLSEKLGGLSAIADYRLGLDFDPRPGAAEEPVLILPVEEEGRVSDLLRIALESGDFCPVTGRARLLGARALASAREGALLTIFADPLAWLGGWECYVAPARAAAREGMLMAADGAPGSEIATPLLAARLAAVDRAAAEPGGHGLCVLAPEACDWRTLLAGIDDIEVPDANFRRWLAHRLGIESASEE